MSSSRGWIGVDLDGTLAFYDGWRGETHIGDPIPAMLERVKRWIAEGQQVRIFTARVYDGSGRVGSHEMERGRNINVVIECIQIWCKIHVGVILPITCVKDFDMIEFYDDRCVQVEANTGRLIGASTRGL